MLEVTIERHADTYVARLDFVDARRERITRKINGQECGEVTDALALTVALLVEAAPSKPEQPSPVPQDSGLPAPAPKAAPPPRAEPRAAPAPPPRLVTATWSLGFSGRASSQIAPDPSYGLALGLSRLQGWNPRGNESASGWRTALDVSYHDSGPVTFEETSVRFRLVGVRGALCGAWTLREPVFAELCGAAELGYWAAKAERSSRLTTPRSGSATWGALGVPLVFGVALDGLQIYVAAGPWFPLNRERFTFSHPESVVHEVKPVSVSVDLGFRLAL